MVKVKICGICHEAEIGIMNELVPDFVGFVFVKKAVILSPLNTPGICARNYDRA